MMLSVTQQVKTQIEKFIPEEIRPKVEVLYIGAEQPVIISEEEKQSRREQLGLVQSFTVGIVGRIERQKGQHLVLEALMKLSQKGIDAKALIVGHAMDEGYLQQLKEEYRDIGIFTGFTNEAQTLMQLCDVAVLATDKETFGLVLIEAMMCGVCVVASDSGGPLEIIDNEINGLLFKTFDSDDLSVKLERLAYDTHMRFEFAKAGQHKVMEMFESQKQFISLAKILQVI
jgi:glycosyltransferase involved in cell wall biosynthesis